MVSRTVFPVLAASLAASVPAAAQDVRPFTEPPAFRMEQWTTEDGLPQNSVTAILQAPAGHLWIGTFGGLVRFDGTSFRLVERTDSAGRHVDRILALAMTGDSALWIGTEQNGVLRYRDGVFTGFTVADGLPDEAIPALYVDRAGTLWVGGQQGGVAQYADGRFAGFSDVDGVPLAHVIRFQETSDGTLWVNTGDRFVTIRDDAPTLREWRERPLPAVHHFALEDRAGARWYSVEDGLVRVAGGRVRTYGPRSGAEGTSLMVEDRDGGYWLGTDNDGLFFFRPGERSSPSARRYPLPDGRRQYRVRTAFVDAEGNVWVGTNANGLLRATRNVFTTYTRAHGLSHDVMTAVTVDAAGTVWAATNCWGVNAIDRARGTVRTLKPRRPGDPAGDPCVFALAEERPGTMWVGTWGGGLTRITNGWETRRPAHGGLRDSVVLALFTDRDGTVWVGTNSGGLAAVDSAGVRATWTVNDGLAHNGVRTIHQTSDGALWVGTLEGLSRLKDGRLTSYTAADGLSAEHVRALYEDGDGTLWIGTYGGGLNRFRNGGFTAITRQEGLADDVVSAILEDAHGQFWMSGNRGIFRAARDDLNAVADGERTRVHSVLYGEADGLLNAETNGGFQPAAWKDAGGRLWFPTVQGLAMVDPSRVRPMRRAPPVRVDEVVVDGVARAPSDGLVVGPGRPNLEFRYTGLSLSAPEHVTFRYRLEGFDEDWVDAGYRRVAYYPRLPAGRYRFTVTAANRDGVWNEAGAAVPLRVVAPVWATWWFRLAGVVGIIVLAGGVLWRREVSARERQAAQAAFARRLIESQEHERKRIAAELHDGLGQEMLVVRNRALLALREDGLGPKAREQLEQITDVVTRSIEAVRGLARTLSPYQLDHLGLTAALRAMAEGVAEATGVSLDIAIDDVDGVLPPEGEINLYRIVQEALSNVVHHAEASSATVRVQRTAGTVTASVADDGRGFAVRHDAEGHLAGGFGLSGIARRVRMLGGRVRVSSAPGRGTRVELSVPAAPTGRTA